MVLPSSDPKKPSPHSTGGSVDVTILDESGIPLDMGTKFDDSSIASSTAYFEKVDDIITENRRLLYHVMTEQGFTNYSEEWWHFDYGNQNWAWVLDMPFIVLQCLVLLGNHHLKKAMTKIKHRFF